MTEEQTPHTHDQEHEWEAVKAFLRQNGIPFAAATGIALVVVLGIVIFRGRAESTRHDAQQILRSARTLQDLDRVVTGYASSPAAPLALLKLARVHYDSGNYQLALSKYEAFSQSYADHPFSAGADLGRLHCLEVQGRLQEALAGFESFATANPNHFLRAQAIFGQGRCLEQSGQLETARVLYEQFIAESPESAWVSRANEQLESVKAKIEQGWTPPDDVQSDALAAPITPLDPAFQF